MSKRILLIALFGLALVQTGCFPRVRQCIANRWHMNHPYAGCGIGQGCCSPAFKVPACAAPGCCGNEGGGAPIIYQGTGQPPMGVPTIGNPMPLLGSGSSSIPGPMPNKN